MRKMKDSGIVRLGLMPKEWSASRVKYIYSVIGSGTTPSSGNTLYYDGTENWIQSGDLYKRKYVTNTEKTVTDFAVSTISALHKYKADFIVIAMYGASIGNVAISKIDACVNQACCVIKPNSKVNFNYLYYTLVNDKDIMLDMSIGGTQPNISQAKILELPVFLPPLAEQQKIADFLDEKCGEIDSIRSDIQKQIDILNDYKKSVITEAVTKGLNPKAKLKDSGIEWIGKIPEGWCVKKLKYVFAEGEFGLKIGPFGSALKDCVIANGDYKVYNQAHVISNDFSLSRHFVSEESYNRLYSYRVLPDDILFSMMGTIGKCRIMPRGYPKGIMDSHLLKARLKNFILPSFFQYVYDKDNSTIIYTQLEQYANGTIMNGLNSSIIKKLIMPVPPLSEQKAIADYLDEKCSAIDATIADKQRQLETLDEYKKSLIFEYVTGKKEVPA